MNDSPTHISATSFTQAEFMRAEADDVLLSLCLQECREFFPHRAEAAPIVTKRIIEFIRSETPGSLIRVGNGEGSVLGLTGHRSHPMQLKSFNDQFFRQDGTVLDEEKARALSSALRNALISGDIIGFRSVDRSGKGSELEEIKSFLERGNVNAATGLLYAREFMRDKLTQGELRDKILTSAWIHLALIPHLHEIMNVARNVVVISGRAELKEQFERRLGGRLRSFLSVPVHGSRPASEKESHCRALLARGVPRKTIATMRHAGCDADALRGRIGYAAAHTVMEDGETGPRLVRWMAPRSRVDRPSVRPFDSPGGTGLIGAGQGVRGV
jgi:hypothetical protein